jgi:hypothetical protein
VPDEPRAKLFGQEIPLTPWAFKGLSALVLIGALTWGWFGFLQPHLIAVDEAHISRASLVQLRETERHLHEPPSKTLVLMQDGATLLEVSFMASDNCLDVHRKTAGVEQDFWVIDPSRQKLDPLPIEAGVSPFKQSFWQQIESTAFAQGTCLGDGATHPGVWQSKVGAVQGCFVQNWRRFVVDKCEGFYWQDTCTGRSSPWTWTYCASQHQW